MPELTFAELEADRNIQPVLRAYETLTSLEARRKDSAGKLTDDLYDGPITAAQDILGRGSSSPEIVRTLKGVLDVVENEESHLDYLKSLPGADSTAVEEAKAQLAERKHSTLFGAASLLLGQIAAKEGLDNPIDIERARAFLGQDVETVADQLIGRSLRIGAVEGTVIETRPQDATFNERYLKTRPIFGENRSDIYAGNVRGKFMLFLAAGDETIADSCVTIMAMDFGNDILADKPTRVADALKITQEQIGTAHMAENGSLVFDLQPRKK